MNVTVADPARRNYRSPVQFFAFKSHSECIFAYVYGSANKKKIAMRVSFCHVSHRGLHICLTVCLRTQFVSVSPLNISLGQTRSLGLKGLGGTIHF